MYPDAGGARPALREMATRLASLGYAVLLPDVYYRFRAWAPFDMRNVFADKTERNRLLARTALARDGGVLRRAPRECQPRLMNRLNSWMTPRVAYSPTMVDRISSTMKVTSQLDRLCGTFHQTIVNISAQRNTKMSRQLPL